MHLRASICLVVIFLVALLPAAGQAQPGIPHQIDAAPAIDRPDTLMRSGYVGGPASTIAVQGAYAYVGFGPALTVLRVSEESRPQRVGYLILSNPIVNIVVDGQVAYVVTSDPAKSDPTLGIGDFALFVVRVSDPTAPAVLDTYAAPDPINGLAVADGIVYLATAFGLRVLDTSNPSDLRELVFLRHKHAPSSAIAVEGKYAYLGHYSEARSSSLLVFDVTDPRAPNAIADVTIPGWSSDIVIRGMLAYIAAWSSESDVTMHLSIVDISNPAAPVVRGIYSRSWTRSGGDVSLAVDGDLAYVGVPSTAIQVFNIADPSKPMTTGRWFGDITQDIAVANGRVYIAASSNGLEIFDTSARPLGGYGAIGTARDVSADDEYVYVADGFRGRNDGELGLLQNLGPDIPKVLASNTGSGIALAQGRAYVTSVGCFWDGGDVKCSSSLSIFDRTNPSAPARLGGIGLIGSGHVTVGGTLAFIAAGGYMQVVDVANPGRPAVLSTYMPQLSSVVSGVAVSGTYVLAATNGAGIRNGGLQIVNVADPGRPIEVSSILTDTDLLDVAVHGRYAYVAEKNRLVVVDISKPAQPVLVSSLMLRTPKDSDFGIPTDSPNRIVVDGNYAYVTAGTAGLNLIDITDPAAPVKLDQYDTPGIAVGVAISGERIYVADTYGGLFIFELGRPRAYLPMIAH